MQQGTVFWDFENCGIPKNVTGLQVVQALRAFLVQKKHSSFKLLCIRQC